MKMDDRFYQAFFPGHAKVGGYRLEPFCLGHSLILHAIGSPLTDPDGKCTPADLVLALRICQTKWPFQPSLKPRIIDWWRMRRMLKDPVKFRRVAKGFAAYVKAHTSVPRFWTVTRGGASQPLTAPMMLSLAAGLILRGIPEPSAWSMSLGRALWLDAAAAEREGSMLRFLYDSDLEPDPDLPDLTTMSEEQLYAQAIRDLGPELAQEWWAARQENFHPLR